MISINVPTEQPEKKTNFKISRIVFLIILISGFISYYFTYIFNPNPDSSSESLKTSKNEKEDPNKEIFENELFTERREIIRNNDTSYDNFDEEIPLESQSDTNFSSESPQNFAQLENEPEADISEEVFPDTAQLESEISEITGNFSPSSTCSSSNSISTESNQSEDSFVQISSSQ